MLAILYYAFSAAQWHPKQYGLVWASRRSRSITQQEPLSSDSENSLSAKDDEADFMP
jgi:hypothetical protein